MLSYQEALDIILSHAALNSTKKLKLKECLGKVSAENLFSPETLPPFDNSAMDGFAVRTQDMDKASTANPVTLKLMGSAAAGDAPSRGGGSCSAWEIMTGAPVPSGYDAVICVEDSRLSSEGIEGIEVTLTEKAFKGKNIRMAGSDIEEGGALLKSGTYITSAILMGLAAVGVSEIEVFEDITAAVMSTGKELNDDAGTALGKGKIRNSNAPYLMAELRTLGVKPRDEGTVHDNAEDFHQKLQDILKNPPHIIISTGAVSMGKYDFIPDALRKAGAEILFHKCAIRPGKPILCAKLSCGSFYFGLPGNPIAAACGFAFFISPLMRAVQGMAQVKSQTAILDKDYSKKSNFRFFQKAAYYTDEQGRGRLNIFEGQQSYKIMPFMKANCWAVIPEEVKNLKKGDKVEIIPFNSSALL